MDELTDGQIALLRDRLTTLREELKQLIVATRDTVRPVGLDEPIGRLTRMDAIQQQHMSRANRSSHDLRLRQIEQALQLIERGDYGLCRKCDESIGFPRLEARPESPYCIDCQDAIDRKYS